MKFLKQIAFALCLMSIGAPRLQAINKYAATALVGGTALFAAASYDWKTNPQADPHVVHHFVKKLCELATTNPVKFAQANRLMATAAYGTLAVLAGMGVADLIALYNRSHAELQQSPVSHTALYQRTEIYQVPGVGTDQQLMFSWCPEKYKNTVRNWFEWQQSLPLVGSKKISQDRVLLLYGATFPTLLRTEHDALDMVKRIADSRPAGQPVKILDIGCGTGFMTHCFDVIPKTEVVALDPIGDNLTILARNHEQLRGLFPKKEKKVQTKEAYWKSLTPNDLAAYKDRFDLVWSSLSLHFLGDDIFEGFKRIAWCLKPGGAVIGKVLVPGILEGFMTREMAKASREHIARTFRERAIFTPGVIVLGGNFTHEGNREITSAQISTAAELKAHGAEAGAFFKIANTEPGQGVGFQMIQQYYSEEILAHCLQEAGLDLVDQYFTDGHDTIVAPDDLHGDHLVFVARRPVS